MIYRPLVNAAWTAFCARTGTNAKDKAAKSDWYQAHLEAATGKTTTAHCNRTSHFEAAMGEFEAEAGESIHWQMRAGAAGDLRRAQHGLREFCQAHQVEDEYVAGIARKMFQVADPARLNPRQLRDILVALKLHLRRQTTLPF